MLLIIPFITLVERSDLCEEVRTLLRFDEIECHVDVGATLKKAEEVLIILLCLAAFSYLLALV